MLRAEGPIGRYEIRRRIATGGMGTLYLAHDPVLDRTVALKLFHGDLEQPDARDKFVREARAVAALNHPNIVTIYDYGEYAAQPFLVMEYIQGETLGDFIRRKPVVPFVVTVRWMEDLCAAVGYAHDRGIIHRDIKPANLMVDAYGRLKVLDFGIARMRGTLASQSTAVIGTPGFMAPEQIRGGTVDSRSDLFSIGVVCYELFSFTEPFAAESMHAVTHRTLNDEVVPLDTVRPSIDGELSAIVDRALQKDAGRRYQSADDLREALAGVRRRLEAAEPETMVATYLPPSAAPAAEPRTDTGPRGTPGASETPATGTPGRPHRRTTRETLARQREAQVQGWIDLAREHLAAGELTDAREACTQALGLEPGHAEALKLLESLAQAEGATILIPGGRVPAAPAAFAEDLDYTVVVPADRRGALPVAEAPLAAAAAPAGSVPANRPAPAPPAPASPAPATRGRPDTAASRLEASRLAARRRRLRTRLAIAASVLLIAGAASGVWVLTRPGAALPPVMVVIDAAPWATVSAIQRDDGEAPPLPAQASTPLALSLEPGLYHVSLVGPPPASESRRVPLQVESGKPSHVVLERFAPMTVDEYFRGYTGGAGATAEAGATPPGGLP